MRRLTLTIFLLTLAISIVWIPDAFTFECERPHEHIIMKEITHNASTNGKAEVGLGVDIAGYLENYPSPYGDLDQLTLLIAATANTRMIVEYRWFDHTNHYSWVEDNQLPLYCEICGDDVVRILMNETGAEFRGVRFYGGVGSAEYNEIWVCGNGWLSFVDSLHPSQPLPYYLNEFSIPNIDGLNNFVAPFWSLGGGYIKYGIIQWWPGYGSAVDCFVISWNVGGRRFQVLIEACPTYAQPGRTPFAQSRIWFQYHTLLLPVPQVTVGIEDQGGWRGVSYNGELYDGLALEFSEISNFAC